MTTKWEEINEGDAVIHCDCYGQSEGFADSDALRSRQEIKVRFTNGPRKGECRWVPVETISLSRHTQTDAQWNEAMAKIKAEAVQ